MLFDRFKNLFNNPSSILRQPGGMQTVRSQPWPDQILRQKAATQLNVPQLGIKATPSEVWNKASDMAGSPYSYSAPMKGDLDKAFLTSLLKTATDFSQDTGGAIGGGSFGSGPVEKKAATFEMVDPTAGDLSKAHGAFWRKKPWEFG